MRTTLQRVIVGAVAGALIGGTAGSVAARELERPGIGSIVAIRCTLSFDALYSLRLLCTHSTLFRPNPLALLVTTSLHSESAF